MGQRNFIIGAAVIVAGITGVAWNNAHLTREANDRLRATNLRGAAVTDAIQQTGKRLADADRNSAELLAALAALHNAKKTAPAAAPAKAPTPAAPSIAELLRTEPDTQVLWLRQQRARLAATYGPLFQALHLSPSQIEKLEDIIVNREERRMDVTATLQTQQLSSRSPTAVKLQQAIDVDYDAAAHSLLGEAAVQQLQDYERSLYVRNMVNGWAGGAALIAREPFSPQQGEQLVQIIANANANFRKGGGNGVVGEIDWDAVDTQARTILSEAQFDLFRTMEPTLPSGGRFQYQLYTLVDKAQKAEAAGASSSPVK